MLTALFSLALAHGLNGLAAKPLVSEAVIAGSPSDLMIVRHAVLRGTNEQIGAALAKLADKNHHAKLEPLACDVLKRRMAWFDGHYPELKARARGVRKVMGQGNSLDDASLPYDMSFAPGCSVVYYPPQAITNHHAMLSRNYDFPKASFAALTGRATPSGDASRSFTGDPYVIEVHPDRGYAALYTCSYDLLGAIDGVNEKGVSVALLADDLSKKRTRGEANIGLSEVGLPRFILDRAASAKQARKLLGHVPVYATFTPVHYIISDATGDSFIFEVDTKDKHHVFNAHGKPQIVTNHALAEYGTTNLPAGNSFDRYRRLQHEIALRRGKVTPHQVAEINRCVAVPESVQVSATLWHAVYDLTDRSVKISFCLSKADEKQERRTPYLAFRLSR